MSVLEIVLYSVIAIITTIVVIKTIAKAVKIRKQKKNGTYKPKEKNEYEIDERNYEIDENKYILEEEDETIKENHRGENIRGGTKL